jgi:hypothetical protein
MREGSAEMSEERWSAETCKDELEFNGISLAIQKEKINATRKNLAEMKSCEGPSPEDGRRDVTRKVGLGHNSGSWAVVLELWRTTAPEQCDGGASEGAAAVEKWRLADIGEGATEQRRFSGGATAVGWRRAAVARLERRGAGGGTAATASMEKGAATGGSRRRAG